MMVRNSDVTNVHKHSRCQGYSQWKSWDNMWIKSISLAGRHNVLKRTTGCMVSNAPVTATLKIKCSEFKSRLWNVSLLITVLGLTASGFLRVLRFPMPSVCVLCACVFVCLLVYEYYLMPSYKGSNRALSPKYLSTITKHIWVPFHSNSWTCYTGTV